MRRTTKALVSGFAAVALAAGVAFAQVPPINSGVVGWLQALYNQLSDGGNGNPRTPLSIASTGTTGSVGVNLAAASGKTTYICGFSVSEVQGATAGTFSGTVATLIGGVTFTFGGANATNGASNIFQQFSPCIPANAQNAQITVTAAANANASAVDVNAWGYQR